MFINEKTSSILCTMVPKANDQADGTAHRLLGDQEGSLTTLRPLLSSVAKASLSEHLCHTPSNRRVGDIFAFGFALTRFLNKENLGKTTHRGD